MFSLIVCWVLSLSFFIVGFTHKEEWDSWGDTASFWIAIGIAVLLLIAGIM